MMIWLFLFQDFWRKLVAIVFAAVIYWHVHDSVKQIDKTGGSRDAANIQTVSRVCTVKILDLGTNRSVVFPDDFNPEVRASFRGTDKALAGMKDEDVLFYVVAAKELAPGDHLLMVRCYSCRSDIEAYPVKPTKMMVSVVEIPVENRK